jgi:hypothetical protein
MARCSSRIEAPTPLPRIVLICDLEEGHEGQHHGVGRSGGSQQVEMSWTNDQALKAE